MKAPRPPWLHQRLRVFLSRPFIERSSVVGAVLGVLLFSGVIASVFVQVPVDKPRLAADHRMTVRWYVQSGQWQADIRTVCAAARFVWSDALPVPLSPGTAQPPALHLVITNTV